jgi:hypothetical protein
VSRRDEVSVDHDRLIADPDAPELLDGGPDDELGPLLAHVETRHAAVFDDA